MHCRFRHTDPLYDSSGGGIGPSQRPRPDDTPHSQETDIYAPEGVEPAILASKQLQTHALDSAATGLGYNRYSIFDNNKLSLTAFKNHLFYSVSLCTTTCFSTNVLLPDTNGRRAACALRN